MVSRTTILGVSKTSRNTFPDERGYLSEWFNSNDFTQNNLADFTPKQLIFSQSKKGVIRGIHYRHSIESQKKVLTAISGKFMDVLIDLRVGSPTFKHVSVIEISDKGGEILIIPSGVGHAFQALEDNSIMAYALSAYHSPEAERTINPFDPHLDFPWKDDKLIISDKDKSAMSFEYAQLNNQLPIFHSQE
jgi:dTDP-4-dehydrorhamnose 3,5-epimerase